MDKIAIPPPDAEVMGTLDRVFSDANYFLAWVCLVGIPGNVLLAMLFRESLGTLNPIVLPAVAVLGLLVRWCRNRRLMPALASKRKVAHIACNAILLFGNLVLIASLAAVAANTQYSWYALVTVPAATLACIAGLGFAHGIATANASS